MSAYEPSRLARSAVETLLHAIEHEPVPDTHMFAEDGMAPAYQRALAVLRACSAEEPRAPQQVEVMPRSQPDAQLVKPHRWPSLEQSVPDLPSATPAQTLEAEAQEVAPEQPGASQPSVPTPAEPPMAAASDDEASVAPSRLHKDADPAQPLTASGPEAQSLLGVKRKVALKNARAGEDYSDRLTIDGARDLQLVDAGGSCLAFDPATGMVSGTPAEAGDFELQLKGRIDDRPAEIVATLIVVADPKSLWTSLPSDEAAPFWKADEAFASVTGPALRMIGASKRGRSHAKTGGFREDDFAFALHDAWHIAAVADGAGSAAFSRRGSRLAVETVTAELPQLIDCWLGDDFEPLLSSGNEGEVRTRLYETAVRAAFKAAEALMTQAEQLGESASKLSTTIIIVIAKRFSACWFLGSFSIGDGGAALFDLASHSVTPLTSPDSGEFAGQTRFLAKSEFQNGAEVMQRIHFATPERFTAIALMSDGITDPKLPTDKVFADPAAWASLWNDDLCKAVDFSAPDEAIETQFLAWLDFWSPGNHDDRTLAVLLPRES